jgi:hypothetical protein
MLSALVFAITSCTSCNFLFPIRGNGNIVSETVLQGTSFNCVTSTGIANVTLVQNISAPTSVVIVADSNLQQYLTATVSGGVLALGVENGTSISPSATIEITVSAPLFSRAESTGTGNLTGQGLDASTNLSIQDMGTGNITFSGSTTDLTINSCGTGQIDTGGLTAANISLTLTGTGNCKVKATGTISGTLTGTGNLSYNSGATCQVSCSGTGRIYTY